MQRVKKSAARNRLRRDKEKARDILRDIADGNLDPYLGYRELYGMFVQRSGLHEEFRHFFRIPEVDPDGFIRVDESFRQKVRDLAKEWLLTHPAL